MEGFEHFVGAVTNAQEYGVVAQFCAIDDDAATAVGIDPDVVDSRFEVLSHTKGFEVCACIEEHWSEFVGADVWVGFV